MPRLADLDMQALIGRPLPLLRTSHEETLKDKTVMITGAGGSIGSVLSGRVAKSAPKRVLLYEQSEFALYTITQDLANCGVPVIPILGNLQNEEQVIRQMTTFHVDVVLHAAAYKHVPLVEQNPVLGVQNNVFGTRNLVNAAKFCGVQHFVMVSTDKAVNPTNVMGATKKLAEWVTLAEGYKVVRFGNVLWSDGSVLPLFHQQLMVNQPMTITHADVTRYFMSIPEAVELILQSIALQEKICVFDMGEPVKIETLARNLAKLLRRPAAIEYIGLRPGEKLHEELTLGEKLHPTEHPFIQGAIEKVPTRRTLIELLQELREACQRDDAALLRKTLLKWVPGYEPSCGIVDTRWIEENVVTGLQALDDCYLPSPRRV